MTTGDILTVIGLILDILGILWILRYGPEQLPNPGAESSFPDPNKMKAFRKLRANRKRKQLWVGFVIVLGFALQIVGTILG